MHYVTKSKRETFTHTQMCMLKIQYIEQLSSRLLPTFRLFEWTSYIIYNQDEHIICSSTFALAVYIYSWVSMPIDIYVDVPQPRLTAEILLKLRYSRQDFLHLECVCPNKRHELRRNYWFVLQPLYIHIYGNAFGLQSNKSNKRKFEKTFFYHSPMSYFLGVRSLWVIELKITIVSIAASNHVPSWTLCRYRMSLLV